MDATLLIQRTQQAANTIKECYDMQRSINAMYVGFGGADALTDDDFAGRGFTKAQFVAFIAVQEAFIDLFESGTNDNSIMKIYG